MKELLFSLKLKDIGKIKYKNKKFQYAYLCIKTPPLD